MYLAPDTVIRYIALANTRLIDNVVGRITFVIVLHEVMATKLNTSQRNLVVHEVWQESETISEYSVRVMHLLTARDNTARK